MHEIMLNVHTVLMCIVQYSFKCALYSKLAGMSLGFEIVIQGDLMKCRALQNKRKGKAYTKEVCFEFGIKRPLGAEKRTRNVDSYWT